MYRLLTVASSLLAVAQGQLVGTQTTETHPGMTWQQCTAKGSCTTKNGKVVIDSSKLRSSSARSLLTFTFKTGAGFIRRAGMAYV